MIDSTSDDAARKLHDSLVPQDEWAAFVAVRGILNADQCARVIALGGQAKPASINDGDIALERRNSRIAWVGQREETRWLFDLLGAKLESVNDRFFHLKLAGFTEPLQFAEYGPDGHYAWHLDMGPGKYRIRKLSFIVQLSDPQDYDGGAFQVSTDGRPRALPRDQGALLAFPSYIMHRVAPVTRGLRRSLVGWIGGPPLA